jgi:beta-galactosidase
MDACDELGMLTIVSNPGWQFIGDELFKSRAIRSARLMVRRDRNRPSVMLWEAALNETDNDSIGAALQQVVHEEYPGDQCYTAGDRTTGFAVNGQTGWDVEYLHNDGSKPYVIREWGDTVDNWTDQQSANRVSRAWGEMPMLIQAQSHLARFDELLSAGHHGSSCGPGARRLCGACLWAGIDHQRGYHHQPFYGGVLDACRVPKFDYYFFQSQRPTNVHLPGLDEGPMVFIANFATFLSPTTVTVFSNCERVRLLQDSREIATQAADAGHHVPHPPFTFVVQRFSEHRSTMYMNGSTACAGQADEPMGELRAEGLIGERVVATHVVHSPGVPAQLVLEADWCGRPLLADGADWIRVYARVCDARGTTCPFADDLVQFIATGEARVMGDAAVGMNPVRAEAGIAMALVQSTARPGEIRVRATAFGLRDGEIVIQSQPPASA